MSEQTAPYTVHQWYEPDQAKPAAEGSRDDLTPKKETGPSVYRPLLSEIERTNWRAFDAYPDAPPLDSLTQGLAYARCPADLSARLLDLAAIAEIAARRPDLVTPGGALELVASELRRLAAGVTK